MRKLIVSMNVTLDGFMSGPNCELDWHFKNWSPEMAHSLCEQLSKADTILLGRVTYRAMAGYWPLKAKDARFPREDIAFADMMNNYTKLVFSKTLAAPAWNNSRLIKGDMASQVSRLKKKQGKNMIIYGSGQVVSALMKLDLIDEYHIWMHPVLLGNGKPLFKGIQGKSTMKLRRVQTFDSGVVLLCYESNH